MKNCNNCIKKDVCNYSITILYEFMKIIEIQFGAPEERQEYIEVKNLIAKYCQYYREEK